VLILKRAVKLTLVVATVLLFASNVFAVVTILAPEEGQVFYGSSTTLFLKLQHTPGYDVTLRFESTPLFIPGQTPYSWEYQALQVLNKNEVSPGMTNAQVLIPNGGSWRVRATEQPKQSPVPGIAGPLRGFLLIAPDQMTANVSLMASQYNYSGPCPVNIEYDAQIGSALKGPVMYQFVRSWDSGTTPLQTIQFDKPGTAKVKTNYPFDPQKNPSDPVAGWVGIKIVAQGKELVKKADFTLSCQPLFDQNLIKKSVLTFGAWKSLEKLNLPPQSCQQCASTYNQIADIDRKSMPLVQEGEKLAGSAGQDQSKLQRLNQIRNQLDTYMTQRRNLVNQYNSQLSSYQMMQKPPATSGDRQGLKPQSQTPARQGIQR